MCLKIGNTDKVKARYSGCERRDPGVSFGRASKRPIKTLQFTVGKDFGKDIGMSISLAVAAHNIRETAGGEGMVVGRVLLVSHWPRNRVRECATL